jgi:hypothetical protein
VYIRTRPDVSIGNYTRNMDLRTVRQFLEPTAVELQVDKAKVFSIGLDDIDAAQFDINALDQWATDASESMGITIDTDVLGNIYTQVNASNTGNTAGFKSSSFNLGSAGTPLTLTKANILDTISDCATVLTEQAVPEDGNRWMVMPSWFVNRIQKSDLRSALFTGDQSNQTLRNGRIGEINGFRIYSSNNLTAITGAYFPIIFGHKSSLAFASQIIKERKVTLTDTFGEALEGLQVYGYKVVNPKYMGYVYATVA